MSNQFPFNNNKFDNVYDRVDNFLRGSVNSAKNFFMDNFRLDIQETTEKYVVEAELPGIEKDKITLTMNEGTLVISVKRDEQEEAVRENYIHRERRYGTMRRELFLRDAENDTTSARLKDGILYVTVAKLPVEDNSQQIDID